MSLGLQREVEALTGERVLGTTPLTGGCVAQVVRLELSDGRQLVAKAGSALTAEAWMLEHLRGEHWPVPAVLHTSADLLLMDFVEHDGRSDAKSESHAADLLAGLHAVQRPDFGFERDTVIAGLTQPNPRSEHWIPFFAEHRLLAMAIECAGAGQLPAALLTRIERLAGRVDRWLLEPEHASLIHGDLWGGNMLFHEGRLAALIDPACYWAHAEIELAFATLFHSLGDEFFARYEQHRPLPPGFFEERRDLYNLYPLLVHLRLFGAGYLHAVQRIVERFGE